MNQSIKCHNVPFLFAALGGNWSQTIYQKVLKMIPFYKILAGSDNLPCSKVKRGQYLRPQCIFHLEIFKIPKSLRIQNSWTNFFMWVILNVSPEFWLYSFHLYGKRILSYSKIAIYLFSWLNCHQRQASHKPIRIDKVVKENIFNRML